MTVAELIEKLSAPGVDPEWPVYLNTMGENLDLEEVQVSDSEYVVLVD